MEALAIIILAVFGGLFVLTKLMEGRAKPIDEEQQASYSKIIMVLMGLLFVVSAIKMMTG